MQYLKHTATTVTLAIALVACSQSQKTTAATPPAQDGPNSIVNNDIGITFVRIPAGSFMMGSQASDANASAVEKPRHQVTISQPFYIGLTEVTQGQWEAVMGQSPYDLERSNSYYELPGMAERITHHEHPATVSWNDAQDFINRLNEMDSEHHYRLPTEAEWEYVARAGTQTAYSFGDDKSELSKYAWYGEDFDTGGTHPVGSKQPNPWGLYDVHGNVWEWVQDWYTPSYTAGSQTDPTALPPVTKKPSEAAAGIAPPPAGAAPIKNPTQQTIVASALAFVWSWKTASPKTVIS